MLSPVSLMLCLSFLFAAIPIGAQDIVLEKDITYARVGDFELKLDLARPLDAAAPLPALVFVPGDRLGGEPGECGKSVCAAAMQMAARRGFVAVSIDVRYLDIKDEFGSTKYPFPAQLHDAKAAIRWLRANAGRYAVDPRRIGALGWSCGADLALMLGLTAARADLEGDVGDIAASSAPQAVVSIEGPREPAPEEREFRCIDYVGRESPPILLLRDDLLDSRLRAAGIVHELVDLGGGDGKPWDEKTVWDFLSRYLKERP
jgi:acetyl esterase/lipase